jgi:type II secretory pathway component GspD/PulD (secretin)
LNTILNPRSGGWHTVVAAALLIISIASVAQAADPTFVGKLAYAVDDEGSKRLGLSDEVKAQLVQLIDRREQDALTIALELKDLPRPEAEARLAPFVAESERLGMALLSVEQRSVLGQMGVARLGMSSLADDGISKMLELSDEQKSQVGELLAQREKSLAEGGENERRAAMQDYERKLAGVLNATQRTNWDRLAGLRDGELQPMAPPAAPIAAAPKDEPPAKPDAAPAVPAMKPAAGVAGDDFVRPADPAGESAAAPPATVKSADVKLKFNFVHQPWADVLTWFADEADLSLLMETPPTGTFNYRDTRAYTPSEAIDLMNRVLLLKGFTLVRSDRLLTLMNLEDEIPPQLVEFVSVADLDKRGSFEIVKCLFHLAKMDPADAEAEITKMIGPQGKVIAFPTASQILVTETAGKLRTIREMIEQVENPDAARAQGILEINLKFVGPEEVLAIARPLLNIPEDATSNDKIRIAMDPFSARLFAAGDRELIRQLEAIVPMVDRAPREGEGATIGVLEQPQLMTYPITKADPDQALQILQTLLAGLPDVRLTVDPVTKKVVALARPTEHATIVATLKQLEGDADQVEVIQLYKMDPQLVILSINKLFGMGDAATATNGPKIDGDPTTMKLWVRGTSAQIAQVKELVEKLEGPQADGTGVRENIRMLPLSGESVTSALESMELFWPTMRSNKIRVVSPSSVGSTLRERRLAVPSAAEQQRTPRPVAPEQPAPAPIEEPKPAPQSPPSSRGNAVKTQPNHYSFAALQQADEAAPPEAESRPISTGGEIIVSVTPNGLIIASDDLDALDDFEALLRSLTQESLVPASEPTVFWLKYVKADVAAETLNQVVNGASASGSGGGSLLGDVASSVLGDVGGGMLGSLLGGSGSTFAAGSASIVPDLRLNALIIQAAPADLILIERVLPVIDRESGPEVVLTNGTPRLIPVLYMSAEQMSTIVKQIYPDRIAAAAGSGGQQQQRQPSPADFIQALRGGGGGGGGRGGGGQAAEAEPAKMTIGVDTRSNSLIVAAPEPLFREVEMLVAQLDQEGIESNDATEVVTIRYGNPDAVQATLRALMGEQIKTSGTTSSSSSSPSSSSSQPSSGASSDAAAIQQRIEFFRSLQGQGGGGPGGGGSSGFGGRGGFPGGGGGSPSSGGGGRPSSRGRPGGGR